MAHLGRFVCVFASRIDILLFLVQPLLSVARAAQYDAERVAYGAVIPTRDTEPAPEVDPPRPAE